MVNPNSKPPFPVQIGLYAGTLRVHRDERGVAWIDDSNTKVVEVILDHVSGKSAERILEAHPHLSLPQIYAVVAYQVVVQKKPGISSDLSRFCTSRPVFEGWGRIPGNIRAGT